MEKRIHPDELPAPDALVNYAAGMVGPVMFHYANEDCDDLEGIANSNGFQIKGYHMPEDHPLMEEYEEGSGEVIAKWDPEVPEGWQFGGKNDTEDGPYAFFLRPIKR